MDNWAGTRDLQPSFIALSYSKSHLFTLEAKQKTVEGSAKWKLPRTGGRRNRGAGRTSGFSTSRLNLISSDKDDILLRLNRIYKEFSDSDLCGSQGCVQESGSSHVFVW